MSYETEKDGAGKIIAVTQPLDDSHRRVLRLTDRVLSNGEGKGAPAYETPGRVSFFFEPTEVQHFVEVRWDIGRVSCVSFDELRWNDLDSDPLHRPIFQPTPSMPADAI